MKNGWKALAMLFACGVVALAFSAMAQAGTVILEGSDAIEFHCTENGILGACAYEAQVWKALDGSSGKPIAVIEGNVAVPLTSEGSGITIDNFASVAAAGTLSNYAALYFEGDNGDNEGPEGDTAISAAGAASAVSSYLAAGGTAMIEDYSGGSAWDSIVGTTGSVGNSHVAGAFGGTGFSDVCSDNETVTALGTANGFTQPPAIRCWEHQAYDESYFGSLGYTLSFFDANNSDFGVTGAWSGLLSSGRTLTAAAEPGETTLLIIVLAAFAGVEVLRRRKALQL